MTLGELYQKLKELEEAERELLRQEALVARGESSKLNEEIAQETFDKLSEEEIFDERGES